MEFALTMVLVLIGGFAGGMARYALSEVVTRCVGGKFPWGTMVVNLSGCAAIGLVAAAFPTPILLRDVAVFGLLGGYTTVSSFALQTLALADDGDLGRASLNVVGSATLCVMAAASGYWAGGAFAGGALA